MYKYLRPLIFKLDPEKAHSITLYLLRIAGIIPPLRSLLNILFGVKENKPVIAFGLEFPNIIGLAAGYDKDGLALQGLAALGFGHVEVGTITPLPQAGNPKKRIFRLPDDLAIINWMGFPSIGAKAVLRSLEKTSKPEKVILGINIGKNKDTPLNKAHQDYNSLISTFNHLADYFAINISSPNTIGLRDLQAKEHLDSLLRLIVSHRDNQKKRVPLLVKLAPDLTDTELTDALDVILYNKIDGIIATNTTVHRQGLASYHQNETGGLSGAPLTQKSTDIIQKINKYCDGHLSIIAVGGIMNPKDAQEKLDAGAILVQVYTGLIYSGPTLIREILRNY